MAAGGGVSPGLFRALGGFESRQSLVVRVVGLEAGPTFAAAARLGQDPSNARLLDIMFRSFFVYINAA